MSINCESCGYRDNGVKTGAAIFEKGKRITLRMEDREDLSRDILKESETCGLTIPEIDPALQPGTLGGRFIAVESILEQVYEELSEKVHAVGDSSMMVVEDRQKFQRFLKQLKEVTNAEKPFALILDDPLMNSYLQNFKNEELGLNNMKVENYIVDNTNEAKEEKSIEEVAS
ncbi:ZPR1 zinc-finger domain-containing protein [Pisolithus croceorrhizus]|nr:ZPR1 zinc-finger domain-containing protein [Pisolithus croceorrhizus]